jgi:hypothetical protein
VAATVERAVLAIGGAAFYAIAGWNVLSRAVGADPQPPSPETVSPVKGADMVVTIRIVGPADPVDVYCTPKKGVSAGVVEASADETLIEAHALCSDNAETPFYER